MGISRLTRTSCRSARPGVRTRTKTPVGFMLSNGASGDPGQKPGFAIDGFQLALDMCSIRMEPIC